MLIFLRLAWILHTKHYKMTFLFLDIYSVDYIILLMFIGMMSIISLMVTAYIIFYISIPCFIWELSNIADIACSVIDLLLVILLLLLVSKIY